MFCKHRAAIGRHARAHQERIRIGNFFDDLRQFDHTRQGTKIQTMVNSNDHHIPAFRKKSAQNEWFHQWLA